MGEDQMVEQAGEAAPGAEELPGGAPEPAADPLEALRQELEQAKAREAEYLDGWQRARAELANARKRFQREQEQVYANAKADVIVQILPIADDLERAFETLPDNLSRLTWIEGLMLIQRKLQLLLERTGVVPIPATGQEFSPLLHEAISHEPCETAPAGQIIAEFQKG
jgi:molecular chaperone GrpE